MTDKQRRLLLLIEERLRATGVAPSFLEMRAATGLKSNSSVFSALVKLEEQGWITREKHHARRITILQPIPGASDRQALRDAAPALLEACELQRQLIARMRREKHFPVFRSDHDLFEQATTAAERAIAAARSTEPTTEGKPDAQAA